jgi:TIR domain
MAGSSPTPSGRIFISYRREETAYAAGWLFAQLADHFGDGQVFKDVDSIQLGDDFVEVITRAVGSCDVLLALIGAQWLTVTDEHGRRRLDDPDDFVRLEIEAALTRNVRVIPILVEGTRMPRADELPDSLVRLVRRHALELSPARFDFDTGRLLKVLDRTLAEVRAAQEDAATTELPEASARREQPEPGPTPSAPPPAPAVPPRGWSPRVRILAGAGVGVVLLLVVIVAIVARSGAPSSTGAATTSPTTNEVIFRDDFSTQEPDWEVYDGEGRYTNDAYRILAPAPGGSSAGSVPTKRSRVYPVAPPDLRIQVEGRRLPTSDANMYFGMQCRLNGKGDGYILTVSAASARISQYGATPADYAVLKEAEINIDPTSTNQLQAVCASVEGQQAVHLELWVNGQKAVEATDRDRPLPPGYVGLIVETGGTKRPSMAEFDNFAVIQAPPSSVSPTGIGPAYLQVVSVKNGEHVTISMAVVQGRAGLSLGGSASSLETNSLWVFDYDPNEDRYYRDSDSALRVKADGRWSFLDTPIGASDGSDKGTTYRIVVVRATRDCSAKLGGLRPDSDGNVLLDALPSGCTEAAWVNLLKTGP